jgi:nicotinamidase-related amidase
MNRYVAPDWPNAALLTIDVQRDFALPEAPAEIPGTAEAAPRMGRLVEAFRRARRPIIHVVRLYLPDGSNADPCRREALERGKRIVLPGSDGAELLDELKPSPATRLDPGKLLAGGLQELGANEWAMHKPRWGAFYLTPLEEHLRGLGVDTVVVCGCNFPNCPRATVYEASERDFRVVLVADATSGLYGRGAEELRNIGVGLLDSGECADAVLRAGAAVWRPA